MEFKRLHPYRFEIFFVSQMFILFGSIIATGDWYETVLFPITFIVNISAGLILMSRHRIKFLGFVGLLFLSGLLFVCKLTTSGYDDEITIFRTVINFLFYVFVTIEIIKQVWDSQRISSNIIFGLISGYVSIGLIGYFFFISIELTVPGSFLGNQEAFMLRENLNDSFMYFSYITLLSIGYGDISPVSPFAQKVTILIGLLGQMYNVIITAIVVGKYINQLKK
ncbi:ion channel [Flavicella sp.]|uniref:ion channel n=1 Tax=Flavicella sp. TaxID=2957742 RepID=UPI003019FAFA